MRGEDWEKVASESGLGGAHAIAPGLERTVSMTGVAGSGATSLRGQGSAAGTMSWLGGVASYLCAVAFVRLFCRACIYMVPVRLLGLGRREESES